MSPKESIKFKATEDVIATEEYAEPTQRHQPAHPRIANEVQIERIINNIKALGPLTLSKASHLSNFCGHFAFASITDPPKLMKYSWSLSVFKLCKMNCINSCSTMCGSVSSD